MESRHAHLGRLLPKLPLFPLTLRALRASVRASSHFPRIMPFRIHLAALFLLLGMLTTMPWLGHARVLEALIGLFTRCPFF